MTAEELAPFVVRACGLVHECLVLKDGAVSANMVGEEPYYDRIGLCAWREREFQLACAHTTAQQALGRVVTSEPAKSVLRELSARIHALDRRKGDLEIRWGLTRDEGVAAEIAEIVREHEEIAARLQALLDGLRVG